MKVRRSKQPRGRARGGRKGEWRAWIRGRRAAVLPIAALAVLGALAGVFLLARHPTPSRAPAPPQVAIERPPASPTMPAPASGIDATPAYDQSDRDRLDTLSGEVAAENEDRPTSVEASAPPSAAAAPAPARPAPEGEGAELAMLAPLPPGARHPGRRHPQLRSPEAEPLVAIVFDDVGPNRANARRVIALPGPLTLSFLPYANGISELASAARAGGHQVMLHMPMQPLGHADPGPRALTVSLTSDEIRTRLDWALARVPGAVGLNNHMGSRFTEDGPGMTAVMASLRQRGLWFLDSVTSSRSVGYETARRLGVAAVARDVFLDNTVSSAEVERRLSELEAVARRQGYAIAIGHPHDATIETVGTWLGTLKARSVRLVPVGELVRLTSAPAVAGGD